MKKAFFVVLALVLVFAISCASEPEPKHEHSEPVKVVGEAPTEEKVGYYNLVCPVCKEVLKTEEIAKLTFGEVFVPFDVELVEMDDTEVEKALKLLHAGPKFNLCEESKSMSADVTFPEAGSSIEISIQGETGPVFVHATVSGTGSMTLETSSSGAEYKINGTFSAVVYGTSSKITFSDTKLSCKYVKNEKQWEMDENYTVVNGEVEHDYVLLLASTLCEEVVNYMKSGICEKLSAYSINDVYKYTYLDEEEKTVGRSCYYSFAKKSAESQSEELDVIYGNAKYSDGTKDFNVAYKFVINESLSIEYLKIDDTFYKTDKLENALNNPSEGGEEV